MTKTETLSSNSAKQETKTGADMATINAISNSPQITPAKNRLKKIADAGFLQTLSEEERAEYMTVEEFNIFEAKPDNFKIAYKLRLQKQEAEDSLKKIKEIEALEAQKRKKEREREKGIKQIITDIRKGECQILRESSLSDNQVIINRLNELEIEEDQREAVFNRLKEDSIKSSNRLFPSKPAYDLEYEFRPMLKSSLLAPTDGGRLDYTLSNSVRRWNMINPLIVCPIETKEGEEEKFYILDGKRRYFALDDGVLYPVVIVSGFPDEATQEKAEVIVNRVRSLNVQSTANTLTRMRQRGVSDSDIRRDMGFKTGEIDKIVSILDLGKDLQNLLTGEAITVAVALSIAKLPKTLRDELVSDYKTRKEANPNARIAEADVTALRQRKAEQSIKDNQSTLEDLVKQTPPLEVDKKEGKKVDSKDPVKKSKKNS